MSMRITFADEGQSIPPNQSKRESARELARQYASTKKIAGNGMVLPPIPQLSGKYLTAPPQIQMQKEYVVGGPYFFGSAIRSLGLGVDDISRSVGGAIYEEMMQDPDVAAAYWFLVYSVLADQLTIYPAIRDENDPDYEQAVKIQEFCEHNIKSLDNPFEETLEEILEGMAYGHKIAEQVYRFDSYDGQTVVMLDRIKPKARNTLAFVVDPFLNVLGLLPTRTITGVSTGSLTASYSSIPDPSSIIPREKFMIFSMRRRDSDPRGRSIFRPAYNGWNFKKQIWPEYLLFLLNCAIPSQIGITGPNSKDEFKRDANGDIVVDSGGNPVYVTAEEAMLSALVQFRNSFAAAFPEGSTVTSVESKSQGEVFEKAFGVTGQEITKAILFQTLATREGTHQTRASSQTQMTVVDILIWAIKGILCNTIRSDVFRNIIRANYGDDAVKKFLPTVTLGDTERRDWSRDATAAATIAPYLTKSQWREVTEVLGISDPESEDEEMLGKLGPPAPGAEPVEPGSQPPSVGGKPKPFQKAPANKKVKAKAKPTAA